MEVPTLKPLSEDQARFYFQDLIKGIEYCKPCPGGWGGVGGAAPLDSWHLSQCVGMERISLPAGAKQAYVGRRTGWPLVVGDLSATETNEDRWCRVDVGSCM